MAIDINKILSRTPAEHARFLMNNGERDLSFDISQVDAILFVSNPEGDLKLKEIFAEKVPNGAREVIDYKIDVQQLNGRYVIKQTGLAIIPLERRALKTGERKEDVNDLAARKFLRYIDRMTNEELTRVFGPHKKIFGEIYKRIK